ncbi:MAG: ubiquinol-cytochrome c reductase iron-sulfur subunit [Calditrichia bacterium]|nr:ubiquinol-cytochrome c reductase iron-sulfur subunit [Calditrichia bacterium]MCK5455182.1 ubiquinol-cytochrome c reductase iron-sulfur subunit [Calditrichia bacterium]
MKEESRRSFLSKAIGGLLGLGFFTTAWPYIRSLVPNILYEPPARFKIGPPENFPEGVTFLENRRVFIFRNGNSFHSISGVCTHLGCTIKFSPFRQEKELTVRDLSYRSKGEFHCPCHGSKFYDEGTNYTGPAPRPLKWYPLEISPTDGQLVVNLSKEVQREFRLVV